MKVAAACYPIDWMDSLGRYEEKVSSWVKDAAGQGADLLVFPEYGAMELAALAGREQAAGVETAMRAVSDRFDAANAIFSRLAAEHGVHILGPSGPVFAGNRPVNRAHFFAPSGAVIAHDKQVMTRYEREVMDVHPGGPLTVMETPLGRIGVLICYDSEFPLLGRALIEAGAEILLVPSATEAAAGFHRVRIGAMARALEGQCVAVHAPTQGAAPWNDVVDTNAGCAAIYGPPDTGFPDTGILSQGAMNQPGWTFADISLEAIRTVRRDGRVMNHADWGEQPARVGMVRTVAVA